MGSSCLRGGCARRSDCLVVAAVNLRDVSACATAMTIDTPTPVSRAAAYALLVIPVTSHARPSNPKMAADAPALATKKLS
jgi:hypothetical protein